MRQWSQLSFSLSSNLCILYIHIKMNGLVSMRWNSNTQWCCNWKLVLATTKKVSHLYHTHTHSHTHLIFRVLQAVQYNAYWNRRNMKNWENSLTFPDQWSRATCFMLRLILCIYSDLCTAYICTCIWYISVRFNLSISHRIWHSKKLTTYDIRMN